MGFDVVYEIAAQRRGVSSSTAGDIKDKACFADIRIIVFASDYKSRFKSIFKYGFIHYLQR